MTWTFVLAIYKEGWDTLKTNNYNLLFYQKILAKFNSKNSFVKSRKKTEKTLVTKLVKFSDIPSLVPPRPFKAKLNKFKYYRTNSKKP